LCFLDYVSFVFFFQAEDGIRDFHVTGVQTCALPILVLLQAGKGGGLAAMGGVGTETFIGGRQAATILTKASWVMGGLFMALAFRSEERRVGKEGRIRGGNEQ